LVVATAELREGKVNMAEILAKAGKPAAELATATCAAPKLPGDFPSAKEYFSN
jgi:hypothetical protein